MSRDGPGSGGLEPPRWPTPRDGHRSRRLESSEGYTWPEFAAEVRRIIRRIASLDLGRLDPIAILAGWLLRDGKRDGRPRAEQWRDAQRFRRLLARLRADLGIDPPDSRNATHRNHYNVNNRKFAGTIGVRMGGPSSGGRTSHDQEDGHEARHVPGQGKERKGKERKQDRCRNGTVLPVGPRVCWSRG